MLIQELTSQASLDFITRTHLGRLACAQGAQPYIVPIYFCYNNSYLYTFSTVGQKIDWMRANPLVCVQADQVVNSEQWTSVIVFGRFEELPLRQISEIGDHGMKTTWAALVTIFLGALFLVGKAQAGDVNGKVLETGLKSAENIAVYIDAVPGKKFDPPAQHVSVDQRDLKFIPQTIVIERGTTVDFLNSDHVIHNVRWASIGGDKTLAHGLPSVSPGQTQSFQFDHVGTATTLCSFHFDMLGYVVIVPTPYFALTNHDGSFSIKNVPPGTYTLKTWSPDGKPTSQSITVTDTTTNVEVTVVKK